MSFYNIFHSPSYLCPEEISHKLVGINYIGVSRTQGRPILMPRILVKVISDEFHMKIVHVNLYVQKLQQF